MIDFKEEMSKGEAVLTSVASLAVSSINPRHISDDDIRKLMQDIMRDSGFLWSRPILVNRTAEGLIVYAGNQRLEACKKLGIEEVPAIISDDLPEDIMRKRMALDNVHFGYFDTNKLTSFLDKDLEILGINDISDAFGFGDDYTKEGTDEDLMSEALKNKGTTKADKEENSETGKHSFVLMFDSEENKDEFEILAMNLPDKGDRFEDWLVVKMQEELA